MLALTRLACLFGWNGRDGGELVSKLDHQLPHDGLNGGHLHLAEARPPTTYRCGEHRTMLRRGGRTIRVDRQHPRIARLVQALPPARKPAPCEDDVDQRRERAVDRLRTGAIAQDRVGPLVRQPVVPIEKPLREVALAATRDMWVTIEHDAQQRGARAALTADEHWRACIRWQQYVASDG